MPLDSSGAVRKRPESDEVFLSPRVIDEGAFEDFASRLKREIDRASGETKGLRELLEEVRAAGGTLAEMGRVYREQRDRARELNDATASQQALVEQMLERASELGVAHARFEHDVDGVLAQREVELSQRVDAAMEQFGGSLDAAANKAIGKVDGRVAQVEAQIEQALGKFEKMLEARLTQEVADASARIERCVVHARKQLADVETAKATLQQQVDDVVCTALDALRTECERAEALMNGEDGSESLRTNLQRADKLCARLDEILETAANDEKRFATTFVGISAQVDEASRRYMALEESLRKAIRASNSTEKLLASRTDDVRHVSTALDAARARADQAVQNLQRNAVYSESAVENGATKQQQLAATVQRAERILASIEPWRGVLLEHSATGKLPDEIEQVVRRVRRGVLKEYMQGGKHAKPIGEQVELKQDPTVIEAKKQVPPAA